MIARAPLGKYRPLLFASSITSRVEDEDLRFALRVLGHSIVVAVAVAVTATVIAVVLSCLALGAIAWVLNHFLNKDEGSDTSAARPPGTRQAAARESGIRQKKEQAGIYIPKGGRIREDGRIVRDRWYGDEETGQRVREDGRVVKEGLIFDTETGLRIDEEGRVVKEGLIFDTETGVRMERQESGETRIIREGVIFDTDTEVEISADGHAKRRGLLFDRDVGVEISADGSVSEVVGDLEDRGRLSTNEEGESRIVDEGLILDHDSGVRVDADGNGHREGLIFDRGIDVNESGGRVREVIVPKNRSVFDNADDEAE